jgi:bacteriorhodopsin
MYLIAIGWIYVVFMMSITEQSVIAGIMTFIFYGVLPVTVIMYLGGSRQRRLKRQAEEELRRSSRQTSIGEPAEPDEKEKNPEK